MKDADGQVGVIEEEISARQKDGVEGKPVRSMDLTPCLVLVPLTGEEGEGVSLILQSVGDWPPLSLNRNTETQQESHQENDDEDFWPFHPDPIHAMRGISNTRGLLARPASLTEDCAQQVLVLDDPGVKALNPFLRIHPRFPVKLS